jgi:hypothetical protein
LVAVLIFVPMMAYAASKYTVDASQKDKWTNGLVGYWTFDGSDMDWSQATAEARDVSGQGNHGDVTNFGKEAVRAGKVGQALDFDGQNDYVDAGNPLSLQLGNTGTISVWLKYSTQSGNGGVVSKNDWASDLNGYNLGVRPSDQTVRGEIANAVSDNRMGTTQALNDNQWHFVVFTWDGSYLNMYVDGSLDATPVSQTVTPVSNVYNLNFGKVAAGGYYYDGLIDEVRIYNRTLSPTEIQEMYNAGAGRHAKVDSSEKNKLTNGLVGYWTFDGLDMDWSQSSAEARDQSGQGNHGDVTSFGKEAVRSGKVGQALELDGVDDTIQIPDTATTNVTGSQITMAAWVYPHTVTGRNTFFIIKCAGGANGYMLYLSAGGGGDGGAMIYNGTMYAAVETLAPLSPDTWTFLVGTYNSADQIKIYVNGNLNNSAAPNGNIASSAGGDLYLSIEGWQAENNYKFDGLMDEVRIYDRALSPSEVDELYKMGQRKFRP